MRRRAFVVALVGMLILAWFFVFDVKEVDSLDGLEVGQRVKLFGEVVREKNSYGERIFELDNGVELRCGDCAVKVGEEIFVEGVVGEFKGRRWVEVLTIDSVDLE